MASLCWNRSELKLAKEAVAQYKEENADWKKFKHDPRKRKYIEAYMKDLPGRSFAAVQDQFNKLVSTRTIRIKERGPIGRICIDGRNLSASGLAKLRENGKRQNENRRRALIDGMRREGLSDDQINRVLNFKKPKLDEKTVSEIENRLAGAQIVPVVFRVHADGTVRSEFTEVRFDTVIQNGVEIRKECVAVS